MIEIPLDIASRVERWDALKGWERRELATNLRALGLSIKEIARIIPAARSSISVWTRGIELTETQLTRLAAKRPDADIRREIGTRRHRQRQDQSEEIRAKARVETLGLRRDPEWIGGVCAYWAEGTKG